MRRIHDLLTQLDEAHHRVRAIADQQECADRNATEVIPLMDALRAEVDALEIVVARKYWPVPSYNDLLFYA